MAPDLMQHTLPGFFAGDLAPLLQTLQAFRQSGKRLVTTNGCFDLLHVGHLRYLQAARQHGDGLLVCLNSDASTRGLKGPNRPISGELERAELLLGLSCVDWVYLFDSPSPQDVIVALRPDCHVKGGDYTAQTLPEGPAFAAAGIEMAFLPFVEGRSTSELITRIQQLPH